MNNIVNKDRPFVMIECWWKQSSYKHSDIYSFFKDKNYFCYTNLRSCGLINISNSETFEKISNSKEISLLTDSDFLFAPKVMVVSTKILYLSIFQKLLEDGFLMPL